MTEKQIIALLPKRIPVDRYQEALRLCHDDLGGDALIFKRVAYPPDEPPQWWDEPPAPRSWAAECCCTACGGRFHVGYANGTAHSERAALRDCLQPGVIIPEGPDGVASDDVAFPFVPYGEPEFTSTYRDGEQCDCPECAKPVTVRRASYYRRPRTFRCLFACVQRLDRAAAVVFWMVSRTIEKDGNTETAVEPFRAVVLDDIGSLLHFSWHTDSAAWHIATPAAPCAVAYHSSDGGGIMRLKSGAVTSATFPDLTGTSAEKTGLAEYIADSECGGFPTYYLHFWFRFPFVENAVKAGYGRVVNEALRQSVPYSGGQLKISAFIENLADWRQASPAKAFRMSRAEVRKYASKFTADTLDLWTSFAALRVFSPGQVFDFFRYLDRYGQDGLSNARRLAKAAQGLDFPKLDRYLEKQYMRFNLPFRNAIDLFCDYRRMLSALTESPTQVELYPPDLHAAHDRIAPLYSANQSGIDPPAFLAVRDQWKALEISDGKICAKLPLSAADLYDEGHTLKHCVGGYAKQHVSGKLIIFIRHARRPERSWFTLNVDTTGERPREIQLHGYSNEHVNGKVLRIPQEVRAFVDVWESLVLAPVFRKVKGAAP